MCKLNSMFIIKGIVKGGVVLDYIILRGVSFFLCSLFTYLREDRLLETPEYNAVQNNTTINYDLNAKIYN